MVHFNIQKNSQHEILARNYCNYVIIINIARNCHHWENINLSSCDQITDMSDTAISHNCHHLKNIDFSCRDEITDISLISNKYLSTLLN